MQVGKREFLMKAARYLKRVQELGEELIITHRNHPAVVISPALPKSLSNLRGKAGKISVKGNINASVLPAWPAK